MDFTPIFLMAQSAQGGAAQQGTGGTMVWMVVLMLFFVFYMFFISRRDKKQRKEEQDMRDNLKVGDEIVTIGGIMGRVVSVKDDSVVIETGADRNKIRFTKAAIATNVTAQARAQQVKNEREAAAKKAKADKKAGKDKKADK